MDQLPTLLLIAWLLPLASFAVICIGYSVPQMLGMRVRYATQKYAGYIAIGGDCRRLSDQHATRCSACWLPEHPLEAPAHHARRTADRCTLQRRRACRRFSLRGHAGSSTTERRRTATHEHNERPAAATSPAIGTRWLSSAT